MTNDVIINSRQFVCSLSCNYPILQRSRRREEKKNRHNSSTLIQKPIEKKNGNLYWYFDYCSSHDSCKIKTAKWITYYIFFISI
jgi:hypothetical protein